MRRLSTLNFLLSSDALRLSGKVFPILKNAASEPETIALIIISVITNNINAMSVRAKWDKGSGSNVDFFI